VLDELKPLLVTIRANGVNPDKPALTAMLLTQLGPKMRGEVMTAWNRHCTTQGWVGANLPRMEDFLIFADREVDALLSGLASRSGASGVNGAFSLSNDNSQRSAQLGPRWWAPATTVAPPAAAARRPEGESAAAEKAAREPPEAPMVALIKAGQP
jgi:hypothetical protein